MRHLLDYLLVASVTELTIHGIAERGLVGPDERVPATIAASIERSRRLVYGKRDFRESGLFELRLGLLFMDSHRFDLAAAQFEDARRQWLFLDDPYLVALSDLGAGLCYYHAYEYERAMSLYLKVERWLKSVADSSTEEGWSGRQGERKEYLEALGQALSQATQEAHQSLRKLARRSIPAERVPPPIVNYGRSGAEIGPGGGETFSLVFDQGPPVALSLITKRLAPAIGAIEQIDRVLQVTLGVQSGAGLAISDVQLGSRVAIVFSGHHPITPLFCQAALAEYAHGRGAEALDSATTHHGEPQGDQAMVGLLGTVLGRILGQRKPEPLSVLAALLLPHVRQLVAAAGLGYLTIVQGTDTERRGAST
jgi:tetratricopeptide (TPR) repeat protein